MKVARKTIQGLALIVCAILAVSMGGWTLSKYWNSKPVAATKPSTTDPLLPASPVVRPPAPPEGYVGSIACASCHEDLCKSFAQHPMGRSSALTPGPADMEDYSKADFAGADGTRYKAEKVGGKVLHHEIGTDANGRTLYDLSVPVTLALGSGTRGKAYAVNRAGILLQSPISWYSAKGGYFELSPGYENAATNPRFSRRMIEECLVCHIGRMAFDPEVPDKLISPYFHEIAIGCERCHGPGERHVAAQQMQKTSSPDSTIVNPARLPMRERESICNQCHLHGEFRGLRYGRLPRDFRPGMNLEDIFCVLVKDVTTQGESKAVSQVEQMRESACFKGSEGKLGCASCHNPHEWPEPQKHDEYYRARCNECHANHGCSLTSQKRQEKGDSCITCHMPRTTPKDIVHASQTDHRVRAVSTLEPQTGEVATELGVQVYDGGDQRLPPWEVQRAKGMMMASGKSPADPQQMLDLLFPLAEKVPDDVPILTAIATVYLNRKDYEQAKKWLDKAIAFEPQNGQLQYKLAVVCWGARDLDSAKKYIAAAVKIDPFSAASFELQAKILEAAGDHEQALRAADKVVELDPSKMAFREQLLKSSGR